MFELIMVSPVHLCSGQRGTPFPTVGNLLLFCTLKGFAVICHFVAVVHLKGDNKDSILMCVLQAPNVFPREVKCSLPAGQMSQRFLTVNAKPERRKSAHSAFSSSETYSPLTNLSGETGYKVKLLHIWRGKTTTTKNNFHTTSKI